MRSAICQEKPRGFTLIELLVVIMIIAILASILFPVFAKVKRKGYQVSCASNLKQLGTAFIMYADDYNGAFPATNEYWDTNPASWGFPQFPASPGILISWDERLNQGYVESFNFWSCPGLYKESRYTNIYYSTYVYQPFYRCYAVPWDYANHGSGNFYKIRDYYDSASKILLVEVSGWRFAAHTIENIDNVGPPITCYPYMPPATSDGGMWEPGGGVRDCQLAWYIHNKGSNYLLVDGHVKYMKYVQTKPSQVSPYSDMWHATVPTD